MCSRYELNATAREVAGRFGLTVPPPLPNATEVRPTDMGLVIGPEGARLLRWGLQVSWDKRPLINARAETLATRSAFRRLLGSRVVIPATRWWEWRKEPDGKTKTKMAITRGDGDLFAFAGLVDGDRFTVVTCAPTAELAAVHDRMPAVLAPEAEAAWLDPSQPFEAASRGLLPYAGELAVTTDVGSADVGPPAQGTLF
ncbi:MAG: SOS response-associated peptidase [Solirubrobacterales bacterium]